MAKAMEAAQAAEVAQRIRDLRGRTPQPVIADRVGISLRGYQEWEGARSTPSWDNLEKLATYHRVTPDWILYGSEEAAPAAPAEPASSEVQEIRADVAALREDVAQITELLTQLLDPLADLLRAQEEAIHTASGTGSSRAPKKVARGGRRASA